MISMPMSSSRCEKRERNIQYEFQMVGNMAKLHFRRGSARNRHTQITGGGRGWMGARDPGRCALQSWTAKLPPAGGLWGELLAWGHSSPPAVRTKCGANSRPSSIAFRSRSGRQVVATSVFESLHASSPGRRDRCRGHPPEVCSASIQLTRERNFFVFCFCFLCFNTNLSSFFRAPAAASFLLLSSVASSSPATLPSSSFCWPFESVVLPAVVSPPDDAVVFVDVLTPFSSFFSKCSSFESSK